MFKKFILVVLFSSIVGIISGYGLANQFNKKIQKIRPLDNRRVCTSAAVINDPSMDDNYLVTTTAHLNCNGNLPGITCGFAKVLYVYHYNYDTDDWDEITYNCSNVSVDCGDDTFVYWAVQLVSTSQTLPDYYEIFFEIYTGTCDNWTGYLYSYEYDVTVSPPE